MTRRVRRAGDRGGGRGARRQAVHAGGLEVADEGGTRREQGRGGGLREEGGVARGQRRREARHGGRFVGLVGRLAQFVRQRLDVRATDIAGKPQVRPIAVGDRARLIADTEDEVDNVADTDAVDDTSDVRDASVATDDASVATDDASVATDDASSQ